MTLDPGLSQYQSGLEGIEIARNHGLQLVPNGEHVNIVRPKEPAADDAVRVDLAIEIIRRRKDDVVAITSDRERTRQTLSAAQEALAKANKWVIDQLDLWDRLESAYRALWPEDTGCVRGEEGCIPIGAGGVVRCVSCREAS